MASFRIVIGTRSSRTSPTSCVLAAAPVLTSRKITTPAKKLTPKLPFAFTCNFAFVSVRRAYLTKLVILHLGHSAHVVVLLGRRHLLQVGALVRADALHRSGAEVLSRQPVFEKDVDPIGAIRPVVVTTNRDLLLGPRWLVCQAKREPLAARSPQ